MRYQFLFFQLICLFISLSSDIKAQTFTSSDVDGGTHNGTLQIRDLELLTPLVADRDPFYEVFWIFGDGNFERVSDPIFTETPPIRTGLFTYCYEDNTYGYGPVAILIDRKTPPDDPPDMIFGGSAGIGANEIINDFICATFPDDINILPGKRIHIDTSHFVRENRINAFIISYKPNPNPDIRGKIIFFFDEPLQDFFAYKGTHMPNYLDDESLADLRLMEPHGVVPASTFEVNPSGYKSAIVYNILEGESSVGPEEKHLFHFILANDGIIEDDEKNYRFLAVLVEDNVPNPGSPDYAEDFVDPDDGRKVPNTGPPEDFIFVDEDVIEVKSGEPDDPNELWVTDICQCSEDDFEVSFKLRVCNKGPVNADKAMIAIYDHPFNEYSCINFTKAYTADSPADLTECVVQDCFKTSEVGAEECICYEGFTLRNYTDPTVGMAGGCIFVEFTGRTKEINLEHLTDIPPPPLNLPIGACAQFNNCDGRACADLRQLNVDTIGGILYPEIWKNRYEDCNSPSACSCPGSFFVDIFRWAKANMVLATLVSMVVVVFLLFLFIKPLRDKIFRTSGRS